MLDSKDISFGEDGNESPKTPVLKIALSITEGKSHDIQDFSDQFNHIGLRNEEGPPAKEAVKSEE